MDKKGVSPTISLLVVAFILVVGAVWYYEAHLSEAPQTAASKFNREAISTTTTSVSPSSTTFHVPISSQYSSASSSWVSLQVNGSHGPISLGLGSNVNLAWTSENATGCTPATFWGSYPRTPLPASGSFTTAWPGGSYAGTGTYQIVCTSDSGDTVSDTVQVTPVPLILTITANPTVASPYPVAPSGKQILLNSFQAQSGVNGMYLAAIGIQESQDIVSGVLPIEPDSLSIQVRLGGSPASTSFTLEPATQYVADGYYDINGFAWIPGSSSATIDIFGNIADAQPGIYHAPFTIDELVAGENSDWAIDRNHLLFDGTSPGVFQFPLPSWNPEDANPISGQDLRIQ